jgi:hypothetical protein
MIKSIRAPARLVIFVLFLFKVLLSTWWLSLLMLGRHRSQAPKHRDPFCITLPRSALRTIIDSRQSAHTGVPTILEEQATPMITRISSLFQTFPSTALILFILQFTLETLMVLVFILFEEMGGSRPLIPDVAYLLFCDVFLFPFLGPIAGIGLLLPFIVTWRRPCHVDAKCEIQLLSSRSVTTLYHVHAWERLSVNLHGILT